MATAKKGIIQTAIDAVDKATSKGGAVGKAVDSVTDAVTGVFANERKPIRRVAAKKVAQAPVKKAAKKSDAKLVATMEDYEVKYLAQKHKVTQKAVKAAVTKVGHSRNKVEAELKKNL